MLTRTAMAWSVLGTAKAKGASLNLVHNAARMYNDAVLFLGELDNQGPI